MTDVIGEEEERPIVVRGEGDGEGEGDAERLFKPIVLISSGWKRPLLLEFLS